MSKHSPDEKAPAKLRVSLRQALAFVKAYPVGVEERAKLVLADWPKGGTSGWKRDLK
jgi:hypothetical protein